MKCPFCGTPDTKVVNSRPASNGDSVRRRRECEVCQTRFTTFEILEKPSQVVVKRDGSRVAYSRERLLQGVEKACRKRPVTGQQIDTLVSAVEKEAFRNANQEVTTEYLGKLVLKRLKEVDQVAYLRFASVYKQFRDLQDFNSEISALLKE